jgi:hypothetical protein
MTVSILVAVVLSSDDCFRTGVELSDGVSLEHSLASSQLAPLGEAIGEHL